MVTLNKAATNLLRNMVARVLKHRVHKFCWEGSQPKRRERVRVYNPLSEMR